MKNFLSRDWKSPKLILYVGIIILAIYAYAVFGYPYCQSGFDWIYTQRVLDRWQSLTVGILALVASMVALFSVHSINANNQKLAGKKRKRKFVAALALLLQELSELTKYCIESAQVFKEAWSLVNKSDPLDHNSYSLTEIIPQLPTRHIAAFKECIEYGDEDVGEVLAKILKKLQIHNSRMHNLPQDLQAKEMVSTSLTSYITENISMLVELLAWINKPVFYARGREKNFNNSPLTRINFHDATSQLKLIDFEGYNNLVKELQNRDKGE